MSAVLRNVNDGSYGVNGFINSCLVIVRGIIMSQQLHDKITTQYNECNYPEMIGQPGHDLITALLSVWKERNFPDIFKLGNKALSEKCGTGPTNIGPLRERIFKEVLIDNKCVFSYKSNGKSQPGVYRVNPALLKEVIIEETPEPEVKKPERKSSAWDVVPFKSLPELSETQGIAHAQLEILNRFGINQLRHIDCRYYTPSTDDTRMLYALFRTHTPRYIKAQAQKAKKQGITNVLEWLGEDSE